MATKTPPFDPNELAEWLVQGLKETLSYRLKQTFDREKIVEVLKSKIPNKNQVVHTALKRALLKSDYTFEDLKQGDATFHLIKKRFREVPEGQNVRRFVLIPGFGDSPGSWMVPFAFGKRDLMKRFDEILILDFPGYSGFLSHHELVSSMTILLNVVKMVCESYPPTVLMGHSLGGWLAGKVAQSLSKQMDHLVLVAPSGLIPEFERKIFADFIVNNQGLSVEELLELMVHEPKKYHEFIREEIKSFYSRSGVRDFVGSVSQEQFIDPHLPFAAQKISVIWGEKDRFVPSQWMRYWVENYGEYLDAYLLENTGHVPQLECPRAVAQVIMHAIAMKEGMAGSNWKKIQKRRREFVPFDRTLSKDSSKKLLT